MNRYDLLDALNKTDDAQLEATERFFESGKESVMKHTTIKTARIILIAAIITVLLAVTAYATGFFGLRGREVTPEESFPVSFDTEWDEAFGAWKGTYALEFESPETCQPVRYKFGWLPEGLSWLYYEKDADGYVERVDYVPGSDSEAWFEHVEGYYEDTDLFFVSDMYYAPQFINGGALLLMNQVPDEVKEETWGELSVQIFTCSTWRDWRSGETGDYEIPLHHVVLFHPEQGWILCIRGDMPIETIMKIAQNVEVEQTEGTVTQDQYQNKYNLFDAGRG